MTENPSFSDQPGQPEAPPEAVPTSPDHPDDEENELADDAEVDALTQGVTTDAPVLTGDDD